MQIEAEVAHIGPAGRIDDHVVAMKGGEGRQVRVLEQTAVRLPAQQAPVLHGHHEQAAVRQPAEPRGFVLDVHDALELAVRRQGADPAVVHVREPEAPVVPARALAEA